MGHDDLQRDREGNLVGGLILLGLGIFFLLIELGIIRDFKRFWPVALIIVGLALIVGYFRRGPGSPEPPSPPQTPPPPEPT